MSWLRGNVLQDARLLEKGSQLNVDDLLAMVVPHKQPARGKPAVTGATDLLSNLAANTGISPRPSTTDRCVSNSVLLVATWMPVEHRPTLEAPLNLIINPTATIQTAAPAQSPCMQNGWYFLKGLSKGNVPMRNAICNLNDTVACNTPGTESEMGS